ncbi:MAG: thioesterase family protein [Ignavibacteriaceae bacterium]
METTNFKHKITVKVRFNEVDMLGVCNNAVYISYLEEARLQYFKDLGLIPSQGIFSDGKLFYVVRNEINYKDHARFDEELNIYSKISFIKNSSFGFEHLVVKSKDNIIAADGKGIIVCVDPETKKSTPLSENFYETISGFEDELVIIKDDN